MQSEPALQQDDATEPAPGGSSARSDLIGGGCWMLFGAVVVGGALHMDRFEKMGATLYTMPGFVPAMIGALLMLLGAVLALRGWLRRPSAPARQNPA